MLLIKVSYLVDGLLVPNSEVFNQLAHVFDLVLQILVVRLHKQHFLLLAKFLFNQKLLSFLLLLHLELHATELSDFL